MIIILNLIVEYVEKVVMKSKEKMNIVLIVKEYSIRIVLKI